ncbi:MAG: ion transporter, partial [Myxococcota bacterium]
MANFLDSLHAAFHLRNTRIYRIVQGTIGVVILLSVGLLLAEPIAPPEYEAALLTADRILLAFFALEVIIRIATVRPPELQVFHRAPFGVVRAHVRARIKHMLEPLVLVDIITVLALFPALRGLRAIRLLRLVRSIRVFRYTNPFAAISHNLEQDRLLFTFAFGFLGVQVIVGGLSIFLVERGYNPDFDSIGDGMWWAIVTITTVGFGDITPTTILGRVVAGVLMVGGMFTLALFAGIVGHSLLKAVLSIRKEQFRMSDIVNHVVVCGYTVGSNMLLSVLRREIELGETPVVIFSNSERPPEVGAEFYWVEGDPTKESELEKANMSQASAVVIAGSRSVTPQVADAVTLLTLFT